MSLKPQDPFNVPDQTRSVALAAFPKSCACLRIGNVLGCVYQDKQFAALFPRRGQPAEAPGRLAAGKLELVLLDTLLERAQTLRLLKQRGKQRTDSTHILSAVRTMNRLERVDLHQ